MTRILLLLILALSPANAAFKYLRQGATGSATGNDWTNAYTTLAALEGGLARGDTGYVADGSYPGGNAFNLPSVSGTTVVTIKKATIAEHGTSLGWDNTYGDGQAVFGGQLSFTTGFYVIDGVTGGGPGSWTTGHGFRVNQTSAGGGPNIKIRAPNITISHVEMQGSYPQSSTAEDNDGVNVTANINATIRYCYIYDIARCPMFCDGNGSIFEYNYTGRFGTPDGTHCEIISYNPGLGDMQSAIVRYNIFTWFTSTGGVIYDGVGMQAYGNVFDNTSNPAFAGANGMIAGWTNNNSGQNIRVMRNSQIYNNVFMACNSGIGASTMGAGVVISNNLFYDVNQAQLGSIASYGHYINLRGSATPSGSNITTSSGNPFVNSAARDYRLTTATPAGQTLPSPYNVDMYGTVRGADGVWDRGAIEFTTTGGGDTTPPTVAGSQVNVAGNLVVSFSEAINYNSGTGMSLQASGGAVTLTSPPTETGPSELTWALSRAIGSAEDLTISYAATANGIEDLSGNDLAAFSLMSTTNNAGTVVTPVISLPAGYYFGTQSVTLSTTTSGATIRYTTNGVDPTSSTGTVYTTPLPISAPTTLKARAFKAGSTDSGVAAATYSVGTWVIIGTPTVTDWTEFAVPQQTGTFTWRFRAVVSSLASDTVIGLSPLGEINHWDDTAVAIRFRTTNVIDCINGEQPGTIYEAENVFSYAALTEYDFVVTVDVLNRTYSATIVPASGGTPTVIATDYEFRNGHEATSDLDFVGILGLTSDTTLSNMSFAVDTTAPIPNPMTFASNPTAVDNFSVTMTATTATDDFNNPVNYYFEETSGNAGATDSGWQPEPVYTDVGLTPGTQYSYYVWARDNVLNQGSPSATLSATTPLVLTSGSSASCETLNATTLRVGP